MLDKLGWRVSGGWAADALDATSRTAERMSMRDAWEKHLTEQSRIVGMPGLMARPAFEAGYRAGALAMRERASTRAAEEGHKRVAEQILAFPAEE